MRKYLLPLIFLVCLLTVGAATMEEGGTFVDGNFKYTVTSEATREVSVAAADNATLTGEVTIPATVTNDGIEYTVTAIANYGFSECENLTGITLPANVVEIGYYAFDRSSSLVNININETNSIYSSNGGVLFNNDQSQLILFPPGREGEYTVPSTVKTIGNNSFYGSSIQRIILPHGIIEIRGTAFCTSKLQEINLPSGISIIGSYAFQSCKNLNNIEIPASVTNIGVGAFDGCTSLQSINVERDNEKYISVDGVMFNKDMSELLLYPGGKAGKYSIPSTVTTIGNKAFSWATSLTEVLIPVNVTTIDSYGFYQCSSLTKIVDLRSEPQPLSIYVFYLTRVNEVVVPKGSIDAYKGATGWNAFSNYTELPGEGDSFTVGDFKYTILSNAGYDVSVEAADKPKLSGDVTIPATVTNNDIVYTVTSIANSGFSGCDNLTGVTLPATITNMGWYPFDISFNLLSISISDDNTVYSSENGILFNKDKTELMICPIGKTGDYIVPESVNTIGNHAFFRSNLQEISLQDGITSIGTCAFSESKIRAITFPNSLQSISLYAFMYCTELSEIDIPASVSDIAPGAFRNCSKLEEITVDEGNEKYISENGVVFNREKSTLVQYPAAKKDEKYIVPSTVTKIDIFSFGGAAGLNEIILPANLTTMDTGALSGCTSLTKIVALNNEPPSGNNTVFENVPSNVEVVVPKGSVEAYRSATGWNAFTNYLELPGEGDSFTVGDLKYTILSNAAYDVSVEAANPTTLIGDVMIPPTVTNNAGIEYTVTSVALMGFYGCSKMTGISLPATVKKIGNYAFDEAESLTVIEVDSENPSFSSEDGVLFDKTKSELVYCPLGITGKYTVPSSVKTIGINAFYRSGLKDVILPEGLTEINISAFCSSSVGSINLPNGLETINLYAFQDCVKLKEINIPATVTQIGQGAFEGCRELPAINVDATNNNFVSVDGVLFNKEKTSLLQFPAGKRGKYEVPATVTTIAPQAFGWAQELDEIWLNANLETINNQAFYQCAGLAKIVDLRRVPQEVSETVFAGVPTTTEVYVPKGSKELYESTEWWNYFVNYREIPAEGDSFIVGDLNYTILPDAGFDVSVAAVNSKDLSGEITIPAEVVNGVFTYTVVYLSINSFGSDNELISLNLPATIRKINGQFPTNLEGITVDDNNPVYSSFDGVLFNKDKTELWSCPLGKTGEFTVPSETRYIGYQAFKDSKLTKVDLGENVWDIESYAFLYSKIEEVVLPETLEIIGYGAFLGTGLKNVNLPASLRDMDPIAFNECEALQSINVAEENEVYSSLDGVMFNKDQTQLIQYPGGREGAYTIPSSVTTIGEDAFSHSLSLTSVTIPASVESIERFAFYNCLNLERITELRFDPPETYNSFTQLPENVVVRVLKGCKESYLQSPYWCNFNNIEELPGEGYSFIVDNLKYTILSDTSLEVSVAAADKETLEGEIVIPAIAPYDGLDYTVVAVEDEGFSDCQGVTSFNIPSSIASIGTHAFNGMGVKGIEVSANNQAYTSADGVLFDKAQSILIYCPAAKEGEYEIPSTVIAVKEDAFENSSLTGILIPSSLEVISITLFASADKLQSITVAVGNKVMSALDGVLFNKEKTVLLKYPTGKEGEYVIPTGVNEIGENAFSNCSGLSKLTSMSLVPPAAKELSFIDLPADAVLYVPIKAVEAYSEAEGWNKFTNVEGVYGLGDTFVMDGMLFTIISDTEVSVEKADEEFVDGYLSIPASVTKGEKDYLVTVVSDKGFYNLSGVSTINIPATIREIGAGAFAECTGVRTINVDEENEHYSSAAGILYNKDKTELVQAPGTLKEVEIAENVTSLGEYAFAGCHDLTKIINLNPEPQIATEATFAGVPEDAVVYVPAESGEDYRQAEGWKLFGDIREIGDLKIELSATNLIMIPNSTIQLTVEVTNETLQTVVSEEWESSDANIADVSETGEITAKADGKAEISYVVTLSNGEKVSATCKVTVDTSSGVGSIDGEIDYRAPYMVFDMKGAFVGNSTENLPSGIYIIRQGEVVKKVRL